MEHRSDMCCSPDEERTTLDIAGLVSGNINP